MSAQMKPAMPPELGRKLWQSLHAFAASLPPDMEDMSEKTRESIIYIADRYLVDFSNNLMTLAGNACVCRGVFLAIMREFPPPLHSRDEFVEWTQVVHEFVNLKLGKPRHLPHLKHPLLTVTGWKRIFGTRLAPPRSLS